MYYVHFRRFNATVSDRPGGVADLCKILADIGVSIKDIMHERAWIKDIHSVEVIRSYLANEYRLIMLIRLSFSVPSGQSCMRNTRLGAFEGIEKTTTSNIPKCYILRHTISYQLIP